MPYGVVLDGMLIEKFDTPDEAYEVARIDYENSGLFHEVRLVNPLAKTIDEM